MSEQSILNEKKVFNEVEKKFTQQKLESTKINLKLYDYISLIKIISSYSVIILHTNPFFGDNFKNYKRWIISNFIEQFFHFGVPFFVLCIGATLLDFNKKYGLLEYFKRRFFKVVLPLIGWNIISYYYRIYCIKNLKREKFNVINLLNIFFQNKSP